MVHLFQTVIKVNKRFFLDERNGRPVLITLHQEKPFMDLFYLYLHFIASCVFRLVGECEPGCCLATVILSAVLM